ncbi:ATP-dependent DNA helicase RecG [Endothiovibrio diazotrophicus]
MDRAADSLATLAVTTLKGVGPKLAERLGEKLAIRTVQDLLFHLPTRYQDRTRVLPMGSLRHGDQATVEGEVELCEVKFGRRRSLLVSVADGTGFLLLRFFHFGQAQKEGLRRGTRLRIYGEARVGPNTLEMVHPEYRKVAGDEPQAVEEHLTPIYPTTEKVHQLTLRGLTDQALDLLDGDGLPDWLPESIRGTLGYPSLKDALRFVHRPPPDAPLGQLAEGEHPAQQRLAFEELLAHHLSLRRLRAEALGHPAPSLKGKGKLTKAFLKQLPFKLTGAQQRVSDEIAADLRHPHPMLRLVQGDVGSGKTVVAALACLQAVEAGHQAAVMAPTELLAEQHFRNFGGWLEGLGLEVAWLSGKLRAKARRDALERIALGTAAVVVGTHALFQEEVRFHDLGLVVVDEQHRFGVHQRLALREKGAANGRYPHQLIMTATPIPRTLAMTAYADLDSSAIDELPPGRSPVITVALPDARREEVMERIRNACAAGRQAYWVCPLIEESEMLEAQAAEETAKLLAETLPELSVGLVHGRMKAADKEAAMNAFKSGETQLLVATTVIEVGVDVPNASLMIIENAERLGLAQLHQLRGRVGRGSVESACVLMYKPPLGDLARSRLAALRETNDGFEIARRDLELRGPGEVLGTRQTGMVQFHIADLMRDKELLPAVERAAEQLLKEHPERVEPIVRRWLGDSVRYGGV